MSAATAGNLENQEEPDVIPIEEMTATAITQEAAAAKAKKAEEKEAEAAAAAAARRAAIEIANSHKKIEKRQEQAIKQIEAIETRKIMNKIALYMARFPWLAEVVPKMRANPSLEEARETLIAIREAMMSQGSVNSLAQMLNHAFTMVEIWWGDGQKYPSVPPQFRLNLTGISKLFRENKFPELDPLLMEIDIEYPWLGRRSLPARFAAALLGVMLKVHAVNTDPRLREALRMSQRPPADIPPQDPAEEN